MSNAALSKQVYLYSLDTSDFYNEEETMVSENIYKAVAIINRRKERKEVYLLEVNEGNKEKLKKIELIDTQLKKIGSILKNLKENLNELLLNNTEIREVKKEKLIGNKAVSLFDSTVTRKFKCKIGEITEDMFIVRVFHYPVMKSILDNGFLYNGEKYEYFTSSAGQIRKKKLIAVKSSKWKEHSKSITCDLSVEEINNKGGINANKYQAYLALSNSASMTWKRFNIDRCIVVDDYSTVINDWVDFIDRDTYNISREKHDTEIEHMDGCGIMLPSVSKKSFMFRLPWFKGLLSAFDFGKFAKEFGNTKVTDIYGKEWDVIEDRINIIFTKSQFKLWKYYDSWEDYKVKFKKNQCEAVKLNVESIGADANLNYQMLQTLTSMTEDELHNIAEGTIQDILKIGSDKKTMLRVLGATKENTNKNPLQKALLHYPELLNDSHSKQIIKDKKKSLVRDAKAGKLRVNGKYTYIVPDLFAFCEWLFLGHEVPKGLLGNGEVSCKLFEEEEVDVLRSPHLYREHAIRNNIHTDLTNEWFISDGIYVSSQDLISKILQFDK